MNAVVEGPIALMKNANWALLAAVFTVLAASFALCFLGMLAKLAMPLDEDREDDSPRRRLEPLQETNGARCIRKPAATSF